MLAPSLGEHGNALARNPGMALDLDWVHDVRVNLSAVERRAATLARPPHGEEGVAGGVAGQGHHLHRPDHAVGRRHRRAACGASAPRRGIRSRADMLEALGLADRGITVGAVCVYHALRRHRRRRRSTARAFRSPPSPPAFPAGLVADDDAARARSRPRSRDGAEEIDIVITREHVLTGNWQALYDEVRDIPRRLRRRRI